MKPFEIAAVAKVFKACPASARHKLWALRSLIFKTAGAIDGEE